MEPDANLPKLPPKGISGSTFVDDVESTAYGRFSDEGASRTVEGGSGPPRWPANLEGAVEMSGDPFAAGPAPAAQPDIRYLGSWGRGYGRPPTGSAVSADSTALAMADVEMP